MYPDDDDNDYQTTSYDYKCRNYKLHIRLSIVQVKKKTFSNANNIIDVLFL